LGLERRIPPHWDVPEPELVLVINRHLEVVGYTAGNDVSSREIEGENSLYLPQAKIYDGSCALGPGILLGDLDPLRDLSIEMIIRRDGETAYKDEIRTSQMKQPLEELVTYAGRELSFPQGAFLMTGTGLVPSNDFILRSGDKIEIVVGNLTLENEVA
jgi:2-dehydro-3-deoxy-D-arabinonate dehydratase